MIAHSRPSVLQPCGATAVSLQLALAARVCVTGGFRLKAALESCPSLAVEPVAVATADVATIAAAPARTRLVQLPASRAAAVRVVCSPVLKYRLVATLVDVEAAVAAGGVAAPEVEIAVLCVQAQRLLQVCARRLPSLHGPLLQVGGGRRGSSLTGGRRPRRSRRGSSLTGGRRPRRSRRAPARASAGSWRPPMVMRFTRTLQQLPLRQVRPQVSGEVRALTGAACSQVPRLLCWLWLRLRVRVRSHGRPRPTVSVANVSVARQQHSIVDRDPP